MNPVEQGCQLTLCPGPDMSCGLLMGRIQSTAQASRGSDSCSCGSEHTAVWGQWLQLWPKLHGDVSSSTTGHVAGAGSWEVRQQECNRYSLEQLKHGCNCINPYSPSCCQLLFPPRHRSLGLCIRPHPPTYSGPWIVWRLDREALQARSSPWAICLTPLL